MAVAFGSMEKEAASAFTADLQSSAVVSGLSPQLRSGSVRPSSPEEMAMLAGGTTKVVME